MFENCIYFNLTTLTRKISKIWQEEFERLGLSPSHGYLLFAIAETPDTTQKALSKVMELDASTITRFVDTLVHKGLIEKSSRGKGGTLKATPLGRREYHKIKKLMDALFQHMQGHFGRQEFAAFVGNLRKARQSFL